MPNRLSKETSPYLLQHAHNPVDWYPWGEEALSRARAQDRPILLSIGYSACHWCHVMERESFENEEIANVMNKKFINIKVDREERPDLDLVYMEAVQVMTGSGGWPMTVFLTPDGKPFFGGTYFPPEDRGGMPGFLRVLTHIDEAYRLRRGDVDEATSKLEVHLGQSTRIPLSTDPLMNSTLHQAYQELVPNFDHQHGGFGRAPKFPQPMIYEFLLRYHLLSGDPRAIEMVELTLERMAHGGMYDQIGGGFHRYSTDNYWLAPHFEKMLYDNALLSRLYLHAFQATGRPLYRRICQEILDYVIREMTDPAGGFYSSQDADSEGEEGKFFVWTPEEINQVLGPEDGPLIAQYFGVTPTGNFEGSNIFTVSQETEPFAVANGISSAEMDRRLRHARVLLLEARGQRVHPGRDEKILSGWNGLMLRSFAEAAAVLGRDDYRRAAIDTAAFLLREMRPDGRLLRCYKNGRGKINGFLEDYAFLADGLIALYQDTFDPHWLQEAKSLSEKMIYLFWEDSEGIFYDTERDAETLLIRPRDIFDNATPCGSSVAADVLLRLSVLVGENAYNRIAASTLIGMQKILGQHPMGMSHWLSALDFYLAPPIEVAVIGPMGDLASRELLEVVHGKYRPNNVLAGLDSTKHQVLGGVIPLLEGREAIAGRPTAYVCQNYACQFPVTEPEALQAQLDART
jgi:uncharacterized protein YyaL (SSP411 family)